MLKHPKAPLVLTLGTAAVLIAGGGAAYWYLSQPKAEPGDLLAGADVIPESALMAMSLTTDAAQWQKLRQFGTTPSQKAFDQALAQVRDRLLTANGFDYQKDIQPWVGAEVTVAFLGNPPPFNAPPGSNAQPAIAVLPIRDPAKAKQILEAPRSGSPLSDRNYKGFQIKEKKGGAGGGFSATVLNGQYLVVTTDPKTTDQAIDSFVAKTTLSATPGYTTAFAQVKTPQPFGKVYVNVPAAAALSAANAGKPPAATEGKPQTQGLAATVALQPGGIRIQGVSWLKPNTGALTVQNNAKLMPSRLPAETILMVSGGNLQQFWRDYTQGQATSPLTPIDPKVIQEGIQSTVGMNWEQDFLTWMNGEFAIALTGAPADSPAGLPFSVVVLAKAGDRRAAETALKKLDDAMVERYKFQVQETQVNEQPVITWTIPQGGSLINRGWLDNDVAFLSVGAPIASAMVPRPRTPLAESAAFKTAIADHVSPNNGHFFVNVEQALNTNRFPLFQLPPGNRDLVAAVKAIGVTAAIRDRQTIRYDVFASLQTTNNSQPLPAPTVPPSPSPSP